MCKKVITSQNYSQILGSFNNELRFCVKRRDQEGNYQCRISTNSGHAIMSRIAKLKIVHHGKEAAYYGKALIIIECFTEIQTDMGSNTKVFVFESV